jgi:F420-0:gamma-glutamyl ligase
MSDSTGARWRKSSRSGEGNCVEVADNLSGVVAVRDSKDTDGPTLAFTPRAWADFLAATNAGTFLDR